MKPPRAPTYVDVTPRLPVRDLDATIGFYREVLGFQVDIVWPAEDPTFVILVREHVELGFYVFGNGRSGSIGYAELYVEVSDAGSLHRQLNGQVKMEWGPEVYSYGRREFAIRDPDQYLVIFSEPTDEEPTTSEP